MDISQDLIIDKIFRESIAQIIRNRQNTDYWTQFPIQTKLNHLMQEMNIALDIGFIDIRENQIMDVYIKLSIPTIYPKSASAFNCFASIGFCQVTNG